LDAQALFKKKVAAPPPPPEKKGLFSFLKKTDSAAPAKSAKAAKPAPAKKVRDCIRRAGTAGAYVSQRASCEQLHP
jgi:hypothetical protein